MKPSDLVRGIRRPGAAPRAGAVVAEGAVVAGLDADPMSPRRGPPGIRGLPVLVIPVLAASALAVPVLLSCGPAGARDLDKAGTPPTLEPCPSKGPGFVRMPGSGTCTRLSGRAAAGAALRAGPGVTAAGPEAAGRFAVDTRTDSDFGEVRTYVRIGNGRR